MPDKKTSRILVIDDEPDLRELLTDALEQADMEVQAVASASEAMEAVSCKPVDFIVTDIRLGDGTGMEVLARLRDQIGDVPAVVITGCGDVRALSEASRLRPVELMTKPLDIEHLRSTIQAELARRKDDSRWERRTQRLRLLARNLNKNRKVAVKQLQITCDDLSQAYQTLSGQMAFQQAVIGYQSELIAAKNDDDVFRTLFRQFVNNSGPLFGVAIACNAEAELQIIGRFGVPQPDGLAFCQALCAPAVDMVLTCPQCLVMDATDKQEIFDESIRKYMVGVNILAVPLIPSEAELIGLAILYRKGEQPFLDSDLALAETVAKPTALALRRND